MYNDACQQQRRPGKKSWMGNKFAYVHKKEATRIFGQIMRKGRLECLALGKSKESETEEDHALA